MNNIILKLRLIFHPYVLIEKFRWLIFSCRISSCGNNCMMEHSFSIVKPQSVIFGNNVRFGSNCKIACYGVDENNNLSSEKVILGNDINFGNYCYISALNNVRIGDGVLTGDNVSIIDNSHGNMSAEEINIRPAIRKLYSKGPIIIGKNVWIGKNVCVLSNVKIGDYAIIGANAVVTHDIPAYAIAAGVPARVINMLKK